MTRPISEGISMKTTLRRQNALDLDRNDIIRLAQNSFAASSLSIVHKELYLKEIDRYIRQQTIEQFHSFPMSEHNTGSHHNARFFQQKQSKTGSGKSA